MAPKVGQIGDVTVITVPGPRLDASQSTTFKRNVHHYWQVAPR